MSRYLDVSFGGCQLSPLAGSGPAYRCPPTTMRIELDQGGAWRVASGSLPQHWRYYFGEFAGGYYKETYTRFFELYDRSRRTQLMELRGVENGRGPAFGRLSGNRFLLEGSWQAAANRLPQTWVGFMGKASAGAGLGAEAGLGAAMSLTTNKTVVFACKSGRLGAVAGFSGGLALVLATGFNSGSDFNNYASDGMDWALSIGTKASAFAKGAPIVSTLRKFEGGLDSVDAVMRRLKDHELTKELHGVAKNIFSATLIDTEYQGVSAFDIPLLGAGAEAGIFYAWSSFNVLRQG